MKLKVGRVKYFLKINLSPMFMGRRLKGWEWPIVDEEWPPLNQQMHSHIFFTFSAKHVIGSESAKNRFFPQAKYKFFFIFLYFEIKNKT